MTKETIYLKTNTHNVYSSTKYWRHEYIVYNADT